MGPLRVLLVDDSAEVRSMVSVLLAVEDNVLEVREAANGAEALTVCAEFRPDVVVLDYSMPNMDGSETAQWIRWMHPAAAIVAFSSEFTARPRWADSFWPKERIADVALVLHEIA